MPYRYQFRIILGFCVLFDLYKIVKHRLFILTHLRYWIFLFHQTHDQLIFNINCIAWYYIYFCLLLLSPLHHLLFFRTLMFCSRYHRCLCLLDLRCNCSNSLRTPWRTPRCTKVRDVDLHWPRLTQYTAAESWMVLRCWIAFSHTCGASQKFHWPWESRGST